MTSGWLRRSGILVLVAVVALVGGAQWLMSQGPIRDGAFVVAQDGSRWVVRGGVAYPISWTVDDTNALAALPIGPSVSTIDEVLAGGAGTVAGQAPPSSPPTGPAGLTADYRFQGSLASAVGPAPELLTLGTTSFVSERVESAPRTVLTFTEGAGLQLTPAMSVVPSSTYTMVLLVRLNTVDGYRRLIDVKNGTSDTGLYVYNGELTFYNVAGARGGRVAANAYVQIALTREPRGTVTAYLDGVRQFVFEDQDGLAVISPANVIRFFRDDGSEHASGSVARIRLYDRALSAAEVAELGRLP